MDRRLGPSGRNLRASARGSPIDRRHRLSAGFYDVALVGVFGAAAAWIVPRQTPQQHRVWKAFVRQGTAKAAAGGTVGLDPSLAWRSGAPDSYDSATLVGQVMATGRSSVIASQPWAAST